MLLAGIANDWRYLRFRFWHGVRRAAFRVWCYAWFRESALDGRVTYGE